MGNTCRYIIRYDVTCQRNHSKFIVQLNIREPFLMGCVLFTQQDLHNFYTIYSYGVEPMWLVPFI